MELAQWQRSDDDKACSVANVKKYKADKAAETRA